MGREGQEGGRREGGEQEGRSGVGKEGRGSFSSNLRKPMQTNKRVVHGNIKKVFLYHCDWVVFC